MPDVSALTEHSRAVWSGAAPAWAGHAASIDARVEPVTRALLDAAAIGPGMRVLELAAGPGGLGIAAADRVGDTGSVLVTDLVPEMVGTAARRAAEAGLTQVETAVVALDAIELPERSFDAVVCREGLMFAADHASTVAGMCRVLRPGGRVAASVWAAPEENPWLGVLIAAVSEHVGFPVPPPGIPGPFSLGDPDELRSIFLGAGLDDVDVADVAVPCRDASFESLWADRLAIAGPLAAVVAGMPDADRDTIRARVRSAAAPYATSDGGYEFPGSSLVASGTRPAD